MSAPIVVFFNNKGGVGKTSLVFHLAWMMANKGLRVVAADLDPQADLTASFLDERLLAELWLGTGQTRGQTIYTSIAPLVHTAGDIVDPQLRQIDAGLHLLPGDLALSGFEDELVRAWPACLNGSEQAFHVISAFWRVLVRAAELIDAELVLVDVGPNLGAINRSSLIAADFVVVPIVPDFLSTRGLQDLGPTLRTWRQDWAQRRDAYPDNLVLPRGRMHPIGYVLLRYQLMRGQPISAHQLWMDRISEVYREAVLGQPNSPAVSTNADPECLAQIRSFSSLMPMSYEARRPVFDLRPADGAFGGHQGAVAAARAAFSDLTDRLLQRVQQHAEGSAT